MKQHNGILKAKEIECYLLEVKLQEFPPPAAPKHSKNLTNTLKMAYWQLRGEEGVEMWIWCETGEGVFIGPESSERLVLKVYVRCYCITVQRLSRTSRYWLEGISKSSGHPVIRAYVWYYYTVVQTLFRTIRYYLVDSMNSTTYVRCTVHRVRLYYLSEHTFALQTTAYIWRFSVCLH